jgi:hypothetical protein
MSIYEEIRDGRIQSLEDWIDEIKMSLKIFFEKWSKLSEIEFLLWSLGENYF